MRISERDLDALAVALGRLLVLEGARERLEQAGIKHGAGAKACRLARLGYAYVHGMITAAYGLQAGDRVRWDGTIEMGARRN